MVVYVIGKVSYNYDPMTGDRLGEDSPTFVHPAKGYKTQEEAINAILERYGPKRGPMYTIVPVTIV